jgi:predicted TPR repeat methyltransferase
MSRDRLVCPDPLAERRFAFGRAEAAVGHWNAAADLFAQALELAPDWAPGWFALADAHEKRRDRAAAAAAYREALRADPADALAAGPRLAWLEGRENAELPAAYVARLFDDYAPHFDAHLVGKLGYRGPQTILAALDAAAPAKHFQHALDLGCGSGLMGRALRGRAAWIAGVDLSEKMIAKARESGAYDELAVDDLLVFLSGRPPGGADLAVAADTLVYIGDLRPVLTAAADALGSGGALVFTLEQGEAPFALTGHLRFRHSQAHVRAALEAAGLRLCAFEAASTRTEGGDAVPGWVVVAGKD